MMPWSAEEDLIFGAALVEDFLGCAEVDNWFDWCLGAPDKVDGVFRGKLEVGGTRELGLCEAGRKACQRDNEKLTGDEAE